jgi:Rrf2 family protein
VQSCRFAFAVHVLAVLALKKEECCSSTRLAATVNTNPVVIRRLLIDLQEAGLIRTQRGPNGGAVLLLRPEEVSLLQVHAAVAETELFATHPNRPSRRCPVGKGIGRVMNRIQDRLRHALREQLEAMTLAQVMRELKTS